MLSNTAKYFIKVRQRPGAFQIDEHDAAIVVVVPSVQPYPVDTVHHTCGPYVGRSGKCMVLQRQIPKWTQLKRPPEIHGIRRPFWYRAGNIPKEY